MASEEDVVRATVVLRARVLRAMRDSVMRNQPLKRSVWGAKVDRQEAGSEDLT